jgi:3-phenylpropionate/trans-cinnamate dioxygenase ferredoxin reductase subunit
VAAATLCGREIQYNALPWFWSDQYDLKLQIAGLSNGYDDVVVRGDSEAGRKFSAFYYSGDKVIAVDAINSPQEFMIGKQIITQSLAVNKSQLANPEVPIKSLLDKS